MAKKWEKYPEGGKLEGNSHAQGGTPIVAEKDEIIINKTKNNASGIHEEGLLALNEKPEDYMIVPVARGGGKIEKNALNRSTIDMLEYINKHGDLPMSDARNRGKK